MNRKDKRTPNGNAMDGFVRRRTHSKGQRPSLSSSARRQRMPKHGHIDGFVPRPSQSQQPMRFSDEQPAPKSIAQDSWADENTLDVSESVPVEYAKRQNPSKNLDTKASAPKWWQFAEKRRLKKGKPPSTKRQKIVKRSAMVLAALVVIIGAFLAVKLIMASARVFNGNVLGFFDSTKLRGEDEGRVNILVAGTSEDDIDHDGADLTDSIMLISIDTKNNTGFTVSIPRDLYVNYGETCAPGTRGKINAVYQCGNEIEFNEAGYAKGGMGLLQKVVSQNLGVPIQYYGKINYTAFKDAVNAVGGITIDVASQDKRGIYDPNIQPKDGGPVLLKNGPQQLDGLHALGLARSRNAAGGYGMNRGDFDRTLYQRKMLLALKSKALSAGVISNPTKVSKLFDAAGDNVKTDFQPNEVRRLYELAKLIDNSKIQSIDLASEEVALIETGNADGQSIVKPVAGISDYSDIKLYFKKLTSTDPVAREGATAVVLNASGVTGLAGKRSDELAERGISVLAMGNATDRESSVIVQITKEPKPGTKAALEKKFGVITTTDTAAYPDAKGYTADFVIILGVKNAGSSTSDSSN